MSELLQYVIYSTMLWVDYYKSLQHFYKGNLSNLENVKEFIVKNLKVKTDKHIHNTYDDMQDLERLVNVLNYLEVSVKCMGKYESSVWSYICIIVNNLKQIPPYISGINNITVERNIKILIDMQNICNDINKTILNVNNTTT